MSIERRLLAVTTFAILGLVGCGEAAPAPEGGSEAPAATSDGMADAAPAADVPQTVDELFPEGEAKTALLENCATCHAVACAAIGQRTVARWTALRDSHTEYLPNLPEERIASIFAYLQSNFSDAQPEPTVPAGFLDQGCTPF